MTKTIRIIALCIVTVLCLGLLASCVPAAKPEKAAAALEDAGYSVTNVEVNKYTALVLPDGVENVVTGANLKEETSVGIYYFDTAEHAKAYWDENKDDLKENCETAAKFGKIVYFGDKVAVNAAR